MRFRSRLMWISLVAAAVYAVSPAGAQPTGQGGQGKPGAGAPGAAGGGAQFGGGAGAGGGQGAGGPSGSVGLNAQAALPMNDLLTESTKHLMAMKTSASTVRKQLSEARGGRDVVKTLCLDDKLSQIDVAIRSAEGQKAGVQDAVTRKDAEEAQHKFTVLAVFRQRVDQLTTAAAQCIGEEAAFVGNTQVKTTVDPGIPDEQGNYPTSDTVVISQNPQCASCSI